jgi:hypothetical protein
MNLTEKNTMLKESVIQITVSQRVTASGKHYEALKFVAFEIFIAFRIQNIAFEVVITCTVHRSRVDPCVLSAVRGEYKVRRWTEDFLLVSDKET